MNNLFKINLLSLTCFCLMACKPESSTTNSNEHKVLEHQAIDTSIMVNEKPVETINENLTELLLHPLDLTAYKMEYGNSNSGHIQANETFFLPDTQGFYYQYMLFHKLRKILPQQPTEVELFNNFRIVVYKYGKEVGRFSDQNEELIMLSCALDNPTLGKLNWYGRSKNDLMDEYGEPQFAQNGVFIYTFQNKVISCHFTHEKVDWFKYIHLNHQQNLHEEIPKLLLEW